MVVQDQEIVDYMKTAGLLLPIYKGVVRAHFNMEDNSGTVILDQAGNNYHGNLVGGPSLVSVGCVLYLNTKRQTVSQTDRQSDSQSVDIVSFLVSLPL